MHRSYVSLESSHRVFPDHHVDRLRTIISYDRICVLDAGMIAVSICWLSHGEAYSKRIMMN